MAEAKNTSKTPGGKVVGDREGRTSPRRRTTAARTRPSEQGGATRPARGAHPAADTKVGKVRGRERSTAHPRSRQSLADLHRQLYDAVTVGAQLDALIELGLVDRDLQRLTKRSRTAIYAWRRETALPPAEIAEIIDNTRYAAASLLSEHVPFDDASLLAWLRVRSIYLEGQRPLDALAAGEFQTVVEAGRRWVGADPPCEEVGRGDIASETADAIAIKLGLRSC